MIKSEDLWFSAVRYRTCMQREERVVIVTKTDCNKILGFHSRSIFLLLLTSFRRDLLFDEVAEQAVIALYIYCMILHQSYTFSFQ